MPSQRWMDAAGAGSSVLFYHHHFVSASEWLRRPSQLLVHLVTFWK